MDIYLHHFYYNNLLVIDEFYIYIYKMRVKGKRILKNGAIAGYVYYNKERKWKWRIIGRTNLKKGGTLTHYEVLGVPKNATKENIKKAYHKLALKHHPNKNLNDTEGATKRFQLIGEAWEVLSNQEKRRQYNRSLNTPTANTGQTNARRAANAQARENAAREKAELAEKHLKIFLSESNVPLYQDLLKIIEFGKEFDYFSTPEIVWAVPWISPEVRNSEVVGYVRGKISTKGKYWGPELKVIKKDANELGQSLEDYFNDDNESSNEDDKYSNEDESWVEFFDEPVEIDARFIVIPFVIMKNKDKNYAYKLNEAYNHFMKKYAIKPKQFKFTLNNHLLTH